MSKEAAEIRGILNFKTRCKSYWGPEIADRFTRLKVRIRYS